MATRNIVPRATGEGQIGTSAKTWSAGYFNDIAVTNGVSASTFTGDLTGDVTGNVTGDVTGDVTGNVTGDVTGDVTGNADTATNATNDANGNPIASTYLPLAGGTMTGNIILPNGSKAISEDDIFYKAGDTEDFDTFCANGNITSSAKEMRFSVSTPKRLDKINGITITLMTGGIRVPAGGYIDTDGTNLLNKYTCSASIPAKNIINVYLSSSSAISGATNNTPLAFWVHVTFSFS